MGQAARSMSDEFISEASDDDGCDSDDVSDSPSNVTYNGMDSYAKLQFLDVTTQRTTLMAAMTSSLESPMDEKTLSAMQTITGRGLSTGMTPKRPWAGNRFCWANSRADVAMSLSACMSPPYVSNKPALDRSVSSADVESLVVKMEQHSIGDGLDNTLQVQHDCPDHNEIPNDSQAVADHTPTTNNSTPIPTLSKQSASHVQFNFEFTSPSQLPSRRWSRLSSQPSVPAGANDRDYPSATAQDTGGSPLSSQGFPEQHRSLLFSLPPTLPPLSHRKILPLPTRRLKQLEQLKLQQKTQMEAPFVPSPLSLHSGSLSTKPSLPPPGPSPDTGANQSKAGFDKCPPRSAMTPLATVLLSSTKWSDSQYEHTKKKKRSGPGTERADNESLNTSRPPHVWTESAIDFSLVPPRRPRRKKPIRMLGGHRKRSCATSSCPIPIINASDSAPTDVDTTGVTRHSMPNADEDNVKDKPVLKKKLETEDEPVKANNMRKPKAGGARKKKDTDSVVTKNSAESDFTLLSCLATDEWICALCQYEIFCHGMESARRKGGYYRRRRMRQRRLRELDAKHQGGASSCSPDREPITMTSQEMAAL